MSGPYIGMTCVDEGQRKYHQLNHFGSKLAWTTRGYGGREKDNQISDPLTSVSYILCLFEHPAWLHIAILGGRPETHVFSEPSSCDTGS